MSKGKLIVLSAPSGTGKTTICKKLLKNNPNWKIESAKKFANKKKLGRFGDIQNKEKDLAIMARAGFDYETAKKILGYD